MPFSTNWNFTLLYKNDADPRMEEDRQAVIAANQAFVNKWRQRQDYLTDPIVTRQALDDYEELVRNFGSSGKEGYYFKLKHALNQSDTKVKASLNKVQEQAEKLENDLQFFTLNLASIPADKQAGFTSHPQLAPYQHFLERLFKDAPYLLSEEEEKILNLKSMPAHANWVQLTSSLLAKEKRRVWLEDGSQAFRSFGDISALLDSPQKKVRDKAAQAFNDILAKYRNVAESEMNSILANKKTNDELRKLPRPDASRHLGDDIDSQVVDAMTNAVADRYDISRQFYALKAKLLGLPRLAYHERNIEYGRLSDQEFGYEESVKLVNKVCEQLDPQFAAILQQYVKNGQFDVYPRTGKMDGAFCAHNLISQPTYILLNHTNRLRDVLTIAHELGHGINNELMKEKQNALSFDSPTSTAEVASTFMEDFVLRELLQETDDEGKLAIMMMKLNQDMSSIFRQVSCYRFEQELHATFRQKSFLPEKEIGQIFLKHMGEYMGPAVEQSKGAGNWWIYWGHLRMFFYVYSYASGILISKALQRQVHQNHDFIKKVKEFLQAGTSRSPRQIFLDLGIDIAEATFWQTGLDEVADLLTETEALAKKLGKI